MDLSHTLIYIALFALGIFATHRLSRLIVEDQITEPLRNWIWKTYPPQSTQFGYLFTCYWCSSIWAAILLVIGFILLPYVTIAIAAVLALSDVVGLLDDFRNR